MRLAIMQPYFLPYIGYYQLIAAVDVFVVYDNIKYTKKGWINRNRMLLNGTDATFSLPLKKDSDSLNVVERELAADFNRDKLLSQFKGAYGRAPYFAKTFPLVEQIVRHEDKNLFRFIYHSILSVCGYLGIEKEIRISSNIACDHELKGQDKVLAMCQAMDADTYVNAIGGMELYSKDEFRVRGIELKFIKSKLCAYEQFGNEFVPWLSIVDVMMFNPIETIRDLISNRYELI
ncbi:MAG: WbqC family protein [Desulfobulbaceae bacterium]|nr:WbqC family protein [Desulfobulbaceae bacterium]